MTHDELEWYINKLLPDLRKRYIYTANDADDCQQAFIDMLRKVDQLVIKDTNSFIRLFLSYYNRLRYRRRCEQYRTALADGARPDGESKGYAELVTKDWKTVDPWNSQRVEALECIECVSNLRIRGLLFQYYIMGYTLAEVSNMYFLSQPRVWILLQRGIDEIKQFKLSM